MSRVLVCRPSCETKQQSVKAVAVTIRRDARSATRPALARQCRRTSGSAQCERQWQLAVRRVLRYSPNFPNLCA
eukprot:1996374-Prymnesium_polylepis.1